MVRAKRSIEKERVDLFFIFYFFLVAKHANRDVVVIPLSTNETLDKLNMMWQCISPKLWLILDDFSTRHSNDNWVHMIKT